MTMTELLPITNALSRAELVIKLQSAEAERDNAVALATKLQTLLDSKTHECEALRRALDAQDGATEPDMDTVPLQDLLEAVTLLVGDGQAITVHSRGVFAVTAFNRDFICAAGEAHDLLDASARLLRAEAA